MRRNIYWKEKINEQGESVKVPYKICSRCEKEFSNGNTFASLYCPACAEEIKKEKTRERVRKHREKAKKTTE